MSPTPPTFGLITADNRNILFDHNGAVKSASELAEILHQKFGNLAPAARNATNDWVPDHAVMDATKDQLKAMPQFKYSRYN